MPPIETADLNQFALYWECVSEDRHGVPKVLAAVELSPDDCNGVRWITKRTQIRAKDSTFITLDALVITAQEIKPNSIMWLGSLDEWNESGSDANDNQLHQVIDYNETPDIRCREIRYEVRLQRWKKALPQVVP